MARTAAARSPSLLRACARTARHGLARAGALAAALFLAGLMSCGASRADPVKGEATFSAADGYARLVFRLAEDVGSEVVTAGSIIVIRFERPVDIQVDKLAESVPDYVSSARRDPDGSAIRLSLARRATINTMTAGERIFVDFLPDKWTGPPPSLPLEVVRELAQRARAAERALRLQRAAAEARKRPLIRVRALVQPTFVRFVFEMPDGVGVSSVLNDGRLTLAFGGTLNFDLADAKVAAPPNVASINQRVDGDQTAIDIALVGDVDIHSFREDKNYIVDVAFQQAEKPKLAMAAADALPAPKPASPATMMMPATREMPAGKGRGEGTRPSLHRRPKPRPGKCRLPRLRRPKPKLSKPKLPKPKLRNPKPPPRKRPTQKLPSRKRQSRKP